MTNLIEQIKRDREDGTPGPWVFQALPEDEWMLSDVEEWSISASSNSYFMGNTPFYPYVSDNMADARLLAAEELAEALKVQRKRDELSISPRTALALAAYRKATKGNTND